MKKIIRELEKIAKELEQAHIDMALEVREGGRDVEKAKKLSQDGFSRSMAGVHKMHSYVSRLPQVLAKLAEELRSIHSNGKGA